MIVAIVLAAGTSSRLGRPKQLLDLGGKPLIQHAVDAALASPVDEVLVVVGHDAEAVEGALTPEPRIRIVQNPDYLDGQAASFRAGLEAAGEEDAEAAVFLLADQPGVRTDAIAAVLRAFREGAGPVTQAAYAGRPAHPTLIAREVWPQMKAVGGDEGARAVLSQHQDWVTLVEVGGSPPDDVDTEEDYLRMRAAFGSGGGEDWP